MIGFIKSLCSRRAEERSFALRAWLLAPLIETMLAARGLKATLHWVEQQFPQRQHPVAARAVTVKEGAGLIGAVYRRHLLRGRCLPRALLQYALHRRDGVAAQFIVGVKKPDGDLAAHAWVEGTTSNRHAPDYAPLLSRGARVP